MSNVISIEKFREENKRNIEEKAYEMYGIIKVEEDLYIYPEVAFVSRTAELDKFFATTLQGMASLDLLEKEAVDEINNIVPLSGQSVKIMLYEEEKENLLTFDITNVSMDKTFLITTIMKFNELNRKIFTALIAGAIKKVNVDVTFLLKLNYKEVESMVK